MSVKLINDIFHGNILFSKFESYFLNNPAINRLHRILQNSTSYLVFPCCKTSRFEHSIGTMNYASKIYLNGLQNSKFKQDYLEHKSKLIDSIVQSIDTKKLYNITSEKYGASKLIKIFNNHASKDDFLLNKTVINALFELIGFDFISKKWQKVDNFTMIDITEIVLLQSLRIHALTHDVGHLPFSHLFEFSLENIHNQIKAEKNQNKAQQTFTDFLERILTVNTDQPSDNQIHEIISQNITDLIFEDIKIKVIDSFDKNQAVLLIFWMQIIKACWQEIRKGFYGELSCLYQIVSGTIDADRLDYIQRDGSMSGLLKSTGDIDRIIKMFALTKVEYDFKFLPAMQSLHDIEEILNDRYTIYKYLVNHHAVKRSDYIMQKAIEEIFYEELKNNSDFSDLMDNNKLIDSVRILANIATLRADHDSRSLLYEFNQINDYWLLSLFSRKYTELILEESKNEYLKSLLSELYENRNYFSSLWKRRDEYHSFIKQLGKSFFKIKNLSSDIIEKIETKDLNSPLNKIKVEINNEKIDHERIGYYIVEYLIHQFKKTWFKKIEMELNKNFKNILIAPFNNKVGIKDQFLIDSKDHNNIKNLNELSFIENSLNQDLAKSTRFFVYYNKREYSANDLINQLCEGIFNIFKNNIN